MIRNIFLYDINKKIYWRGLLFLRPYSLANFLKKWFTVYEIKINEIR